MELDMILDDFKRELKCGEKTDGYYDRDTGRWVDGKDNEVKFKGAILPLSEKDLKYLQEGSYTLDTVKLYTDVSIKNNTYVTDIENSEKYKVTGGIGYNQIHRNFKRYFMQRIDDINA